MRNTKDEQNQNGKEVRSRFVLQRNKAKSEGENREKTPEITSEKLL